MTITQLQTPATNGTRLKPWRDVMRPNQDVLNGSFQEADFAANLQAVHDSSTTAAEYGDPREFFRRTYPTVGIRNLLTTAVQRISGNGGNPIIQTKTGFGGGKTHSLIALYHLIKSNHELLSLPDTPQYARVRNEIRKIMIEAGASPHTGIRAKIAVLSGTWLSPNTTRATATGAPLNTLWGEMAYQLDDQEAYEIIGAAARNGDAPGGEELDALFQLVGPCIILMDEIVNYARNANIDRIATFIQNLTESVPRQKNAVLVVSLPVSSIEAGGEKGMEVLAALSTILDRTNSVMRVAETGNDEAFAVVRRRLFQDEPDETSRDETCRAFHRMYQNGSTNYPPESRETRYLERIRNCYPIHPEIFDRLYENWSVYPQFQRTRGVLRLMAQTISRLCADGSLSSLIMPGDLPFSDGRISDVFTTLLGSQWNGVMTEVDQENSRTHQIDQQKPVRYGAVGGAARRIARTVFLGSSTQGAVRGISARQINLGVAIPGHGTAVYADALRDMDGQLYHFYQGSDGRYYFDTQENLNKVANDRAAEMSNEHLDSEIIRRLNEFRSNNENQAVSVCPQSPTDVSDDEFTRLVILPPHQTRPSRTAEQDYASEAATLLLSSRGGEIRRKYPNTLLFLAAASDGIRELRIAARRFLAWDSIINGDRRIHNLDGERRTLASNQQNITDQALQNALENAYRWIMAPSQPDSLNATYDTDKWQSITSAPDIAANAFEKFIRDEQIVDNLTPTALNRRLQEYIWNSPTHQHHLTVAELWNILISHVYMRLRLRNRQVLDDCLTKGITAGVFARADSYDANTREYSNLSPRISEADFPHHLPLSDTTLIVEANEAENIRAVIDTPSSVLVNHFTNAESISKENNFNKQLQGSPMENHPCRFIARKTVPWHDFPDHNFNMAIREEIARTMADAGGDVTIEVTITGHQKGGFPENIARSLRDNSKMLGIDLEEDTAN